MNKIKFLFIGLLAIILSGCHTTLRTTDTHAQQFASSQIVVYIDYNFSCSHCYYEMYWCPFCQTFHVRVDHWCNHHYGWYHNWYVVHYYHPHIYSYYYGHYHNHYIHRDHSRHYVRNSQGLRNYGNTNYIKSDRIKTDVKRQDIKQDVRQDKRQDIKRQNPRQDKRQDIKRQDVQDKHQIKQTPPVKKQNPPRQMTRPPNKQIDKRR